MPTYKYKSMKCIALHLFKNDLYKLHYATHNTNMDRTKCSASNFVRYIQIWH